MSIMCKMNGKCTAKKGMCIHEKMMMAIITIGVIGYFIFA
jgi:hypothetical protein